MRVLTTLSIIAFAIFSTANAATITYSLTSLGGNDYSASLSIENDSLSAPIEEFTIFFPVGDYENISILNSPIDWDGLAIDPDLGVPDDGFADWLALGAPIGVGETLTGFVVFFTFLGSGMPGEFLFDIVDPLTFATLESGIATLANQPSPIPLPGAVYFFAVGLAGLARLRILR